MLNKELRERFGRYPLTIILEFISGLPLPDAGQYKYYSVKSSDGLSCRIWGANSSEILEQFEDFTDLLIIS